MEVIREFQEFHGCMSRMTLRLCFYVSILLSYASILLSYVCMLLYFYASILLYFYTSMLLYFYASMLLYFYTSMLLYFYTSILLYFYSKDFLQNGKRRNVSDVWHLEQRQGSRCGARDELMGLIATCVQVRPFGVYALGRNLLLSECDRFWLLASPVSQT